MGLVSLELQLYGDAISYFEDVLAMDPNFRKAQQYLANVKKGKAGGSAIPAKVAELQREAERTLAEGLIDRAAEYFRDAGQYCFESAEPELAVQFYRRAVELKKNNYAGQFNLAVALTRVNQIALAAEHLQQAIQIEPNNADAHFSLGQLLAHLGKLPEARAEFQRVLAINPNHNAARQALAALDSE